MSKISTLLFLTLVIVGCSSVPSRIARLEPLPDVVPVQTMTVPYPIILLHGLGQKADAWNGNATKYYVKELGLRDGGVLRVDKEGAVVSSETGRNDGDLYVMQFRSSHDSINAWRDELDAAVTYVLSQTGADRVILVGYSMGGLAARAYLTKRYTDHHVKRLITIGTPHLGSVYAKVWNWKTQMESCVSTGNMIAVPFCKAALSAIQGAEGNVPYDAPAVRDLRRPEDGGDYLRKLGKYAHPLDVEYVSVIGDVDVSDELKKFNEAALQEVIRKALAILNGSVEEAFEGGDGVVSRRSQDIMNIEYFALEPSRKRAARTIQVGSVHIDHLQQSTEIQRISLDEKPELKGAGIYRLADSAALAITYTDHIPAKCTVNVRILRNTDVVFERTLTATDAQLIRTTDGIVSRVVVSLPSSLFPENERLRASFTITNAWGYAVKSGVEL